MRTILSLLFVTMFAVLRVTPAQAHPGIPLDSDEQMYRRIERYPTRFARGLLLLLAERIVRLDMEAIVKLRHDRSEEDRSEARELATLGWPAAAAMSHMVRSDDPDVFQIETPLPVTLLGSPAAYQIQYDLAKEVLGYTRFWLVMLALPRMQVIPRYQRTAIAALAIPSALVRLADTQNSPTPYELETIVLVLTSQVPQAMSASFYNERERELAKVLETIGTQCQGTSSEYQDACRLASLVSAIGTCVPRTQGAAEARQCLAEQRERFQSLARSWRQDQTVEHTLIRELCELGQHHALLRPPLQAAEADKTAFVEAVALACNP